VKRLVKLAEIQPSATAAHPGESRDERSDGQSRNRVVVTRAATRENAANLAPGWVEAMEEAYAGSHLLPQELEGVLVEDLPGAIFSRKTIEANRAAPGDATGLERIVVAVDPPAGAGEKAAACGIVCAGIRAGVVYVLEDASVRGLRPLEWARRVTEVARRRGAGRIIAESNQGGEMVRELLRMAGAEEISRLALRAATASKRDRAEPVSAMYDHGWRCARRRRRSATGRSRCRRCTITAWCAMPACSASWRTSSARSERPKQDRRRIASMRWCGRCAS
jgi:phage terminase large subunit-like protein